MRLDIGNVYDWFRNPIPSPVRLISFFSLFVILLYVVSKQAVF